MSARAESFVLMGHDGPSHIAIAAEQPALRALKVFHAEPAAGFALPPAEFRERWCALGPTHHVALGVGQVASEVRCVARLLGLEDAQL